jgi:hypothetical protein
MATAEYFNLSGNSFTNVQEGTALYDMVHRMTNWGEREVIQWSGTNGGGKFTTLPDEMFVFKNLVQLDLSYNEELTGEKNCNTHHIFAKTYRDFQVCRTPSGTSRIFKT